MADSETYDLVSKHYATHAILSQSEDTTVYNSSVATAFGYSPEDLAAIPANSNLGLSCGNPLATAAIKEGETMIDLGSGAGLDVFLAARAVGKTGKAIGVDMTDDMLKLAERNKVKGGYENVEFVKANITSIPLPDASADVITSNCVINLVPTPEKPQVFAEIFRLLKAGGRVAISDILAKRDFPDIIRQDVGLYVGCVSGAVLVEEYEKWMRSVGFQDIIILDTKKDLNIYKDGILSGAAVEASGCCEPKPVAASGCCGAPSTACAPKPVGASGCCGVPSNACAAPGGDTGREGRVQGLDLNEYCGSFQIYAVKPAAV